MGGKLSRREESRRERLRAYFDASDYRNNIPRFAPEARKANHGLVDRLRAIGTRHGATPAQIALAWLLAQKPWIIPLFGTRKLERLVENLGSLAVTLTAADLEEIDQVSSTMTIQGARYPEAMLRRSVYERAEAEVIRR